MKEDPFDTTPMPIMFKQSWKYQTVFIHRQNMDNMISILDEQGKEGWELVQLISLSHGNHNALMKRMEWTTI